MQTIVVTGCGTNVGKTIVSAVLLEALGWSYWKPIECGEKDTLRIQELTDAKIIPPLYQFSHALSPHHAASLAEQVILPFKVPVEKVIVETAGGALVPCTFESTTLDYLQGANVGWIVVSRHYLGSINHTLLTLEVLKRRGERILGVIFNGEPYLEGERVILEMGQVPMIGRLLPAACLNKQCIKEYADLWRFGIHSLIQSVSVIH